MRVFIGKSPVTLSKKDFVMQGGEGSIYVRGDTAYKLYADPKNMIPDAKVIELSVLTSPRIVRPEEVIVSAKGQLLGYTMRALLNTNPLCKLFTKAFKQRNGLDANAIIALVQDMRATMEHVHAGGVLVVDANELNFLVSEDFSVVHFIDVDSYQTPHFPATAIMDSIRDRHASTFDIGTDWFSWAIVTWQLMTGIHPYKGKHPSIKGLDARMLQNTSVLSPDVTVPALCPSWVDVVPANYLDWYRAVFEEGKRVPPPRDLVAAMALSAPVVKTITGTGNFDIESLEDFGAAIIFAHYCRRWLGRGLAVATTAGVNLYGKVDSSAAGRVSHMSRIDRHDNPALVWQDSNGLMHVQEMFSSDTHTFVQVDGIMSYRGCVYAKVGEGLHEVVARKMGAKTVVSLAHRANVMHRATHLFDGVVIQNMLGAWFATILPEPGNAYNVPLPDLKGYKIIDAKFDGGVLMILGAESGQYDKFIFTFDEKFTSYLRLKIYDAAYTELNFTTLDSGICAHVVEDGKLELFHVKRPGAKVIKDPMIRGDMRLFSDSASVKFSQGSRIYSIKMK